MTELPAGWESRAVGDVLASPLINGRSVPDRPGGFPVLRLTAIRDRRVAMTQRKEGAWSAAEAERFLVAEGDLLVVRGNGSLDLVGRGGLVGPVVAPVAFPDTMIRLRADSATVDRRYLALLWDSPVVRRQLEAEARTTAGIYKINQTHLRRVRIPVPELAEQRRIVDILEDHLSRLDAATRSLGAAETRLHALNASALDSVIDRNSNRVPLRTLVAHIEAGRSFGGSNAPAAAGEWGIIKVSAMTWGEFRPGENKAIPAAQADARFEIRPGDLLVSRANTSTYVGAAVLVRETPPHLLLSDKSLRLKTRTGVDPEWLQLALSAPRVRREISGRATGTKESMRNISQVSLAEVALPFAAPEEQAAQVARVTHLRAAARSLAAEQSRATRRAASLRRALLAAAFSGRLTGRSSDLDLVEELIDA